MYSISGNINFGVNIEELLCIVSFDTIPTIYFLWNLERVHWNFNSYFKRSKKEGNNKDVNTAQGLGKKFRELYVAKLPVAMTNGPLHFCHLFFTFLLNSNLFHLLFCVIAVLFNYF